MLKALTLICWMSILVSASATDTEQSLFTLVDSEGSGIEGEQLGLLLYKGGTVCDDSFDTTAANAICKYMGYIDATRWTSEESFDIQSNFEINLDNVDCSSAEWESCSFSEDHDCVHSEDVFLSCNLEEEEESPTAVESALIWITAQHDAPYKFDTYCDLKVVTAGNPWHPFGRNWNGDVRFLADDLEMLLIGLHPERGKLEVGNNVFRRGTLMPIRDYRWVGATYPQADDEGKREYTFQFTPTGFVLKCADMVLITIPYEELTDDKEEFLSSINSVKFELKLSPEKGPISLQYARSMCQLQDTEQPLFTLVDSEGSDIEGEQLGLLLYKGGTVCDDYFDTTAANAICRQMGYTSATRWTNQESFNIQSNFEINLDNVDCSNAEWEVCSFSEVHNCGHNEDVFLSCFSEEEEENPIVTEQSLFTLVDSEGSDIDGEQLGLLLYKGGTVCDDNFDAIAANAICKYMGYTAATRWINVESFDIQSNFQINLDNVDCSSAEWEGCSFSEDHDCVHSEDVFLSCN